MNRQVIRMADAALGVLAARQQLARAEEDFAEACRRAHASGVAKTKLSGELSAVLERRGVVVPARAGFGCSSLRNIIDRPAEPPA